MPSSDDVEKSITALIPFWDLANHDNGELSTDFDPESQSTSCMAPRDFKTGEQFTIYYGTRTNVDLVIVLHGIHPLTSIWNLNTGLVQLESENWISPVSE